MGIPLRSTWLLVMIWFVMGVWGSARVLVVFPLPRRSHSIVGHSVVDILLNDGHEVTYVTAFPRKSDDPRLTYVDISSVLDEVTGLNLEHLARHPRAPHEILKIGPSFTRRGLLHPAMQALLHDTSVTFDAVIGEWFFSGLLAPLAAVYDCPLIWYTAGDVSWYTLRLVHEASSPSYTVNMQSRHVPAQPYSVIERVSQLWSQMYLSGWVFYMTNYIEIPAYYEIYTQPLNMRGRLLSDYESLVFNASLLLINSHPPLGQRMPLPQNAVYVGTHHVELPTKPLPDDLQKLLDEAKNGVIFFSMGSNLKSTDFPERMKRELVQLLGHLEQTVLWKFEEKLANLPSNLHILDWAPQASILNHSNTILFITHGGLLSSIEAIHYGVPTIGIPLFGDQFVNVDLAAERGFGLRVDFNDDLPYKIKEAVNEMLANFSYRSAARHASSMFRDRLATPQHELAHWVGVAMRTRGAPHLRSPARLLQLSQRLYLDILLLILVALWFLSKVVKVVRMHWKTIDEVDKKEQ